MDKSLASSNMLTLILFILWSLLLLSRLNQKCEKLSQLFHRGISFRKHYRKQPGLLMIHIQVYYNPLIPSYNLL